MPASPGQNLPALLRYLESEFGGRFFVRTTSYTLTATAQQVAANNYDRMALTLVNTGAEPVYVLPAAGVSATNGILLGASGGILSLAARSDLILVGYGWQGVSNSTGSNLTVIEVVRYE